MTGVIDQCGQSHLSSLTAPEASLFISSLSTSHSGADHKSNSSLVGDNESQDFDQEFRLHHKWTPISQVPSESDALGGQMGQVSLDLNSLGSPIANAINFETAHCAASRSIALDMDLQSSSGPCIMTDAPFRLWNKGMESSAAATELLRPIPDLDHCIVQQVGMELTQVESARSQPAGSNLLFGRWNLALIAAATTGITLSALLIPIVARRLSRS